MDNSIKLHECVHAWYFPKEVGDPLGDLVENDFKNVFVRLKF